MYTPAYLFAPSWVAGNALHARGMGATYRPLSIQIAVHVAVVHVHASTQDVRDLRDAEHAPDRAHHHALSHRVGNLQLAFVEFHKSNKGV
eukprot:SAG25_NODE_1558_length_2766_cov_4.634904_3_plen_90_part_00